MPFHQGLRLKKYIEESGKTLKQISEKSKIPISSIHDLYKKDEDKTTKSIKKVLLSIEIPYDDFMEIKSSEFVKQLNSERDEWRDKYYALLERFSDLQDSSNILNKKIRVKQ